MGMMYLAALAAAKKQQDRRHAAARRTRRRREAEERNSKEKSGYSRVSSNDKPSYFACVIYELSKDADLKDFFQKLYKKVHEVRDDAGRKYREQAEKFLAIANKYEDERCELEEKLKASGVKFDENNQLACISMGRFSSEVLSNTWNKSRLSLYREAVVSSRYEYRGVINGLEHNKITEELLMEDEPLAKLNCAKESLSKNESELASTKKELDKIKKKKLFISAERKENKIVQLTNKISELDRAVYLNREAIKRYEFVLGLTDEQKTDLIKYIKAEKGITTAAYEVESLGDKFVKAIPEIDSKEVMLGALKLLEKEGLTEEEITQIFKKLDRIAIIRGRGEYEIGGISPYDVDIGIIKGFVRQIYEEDPDFVDRNLSEIVSLENEEKDKECENSDVSDGSENPEH